MKKLLILLTIFASSSHAETIDLDCTYKTNWNGQPTTGTHSFSIDTRLKMMYGGGETYILEVQPHQYVAYPRYLFSNDELLLINKGVFPDREFHYIINREDLNYYGRGVLAPSYLGGKCTVINRDNII